MHQLALRCWTELKRHLSVCAAEQDAVYVSCRICVNKSLVSATACRERGDESWGSVQGAQILAFYTVRHKTFVFSCLTVTRSRSVPARMHCL